MHKNPFVIGLGVLAIFVFGFIFLRGPTPHIAVAAEPIVTVTGIELTNTMITTWCIVALIIVSVFLLTRRWKMVPHRMQNLVESILEGFYNIVVNVAGEKNGRRFFPVVATIFLFVVISNWMSLTPVFNVWGPVQNEDHGFVLEKTTVAGINIAWAPLSHPGRLSGTTIESDDPNHVQLAEEARAEGKVVGELFPVFRGPNTDVNTPLALAIASVFIIQFWGVTSLGLFGYGRKFFNFNNIFKGLFTLNFGLLFTGIIDAFVGLLELVSELVRLVSFTARLFGNMFAGEVVILMMTFLTPLVLTLPFYGLELFVGLIQGFIFAMLTLVFGVMAVSHAHGEHPEEHERVAGHGEGTVEEALEEAALPAGAH